MSNGKTQEPDTTALRQAAKEARQKLNEAATPAERFGAQRRLNSILRQMQAAGMDTSLTAGRAVAPRQAPAPARPATQARPATPARPQTAQEAMAERRRVERELGIERGGTKKDTVPDRIRRKGG